jgi:hypothetical protein
MGISISFAVSFRNDREVYQVLACLRVYLWFLGRFEGSVYMSVSEGVCFGGRGLVWRLIEGSLL